MILARVVGTVVATRKDPRLEGKKLLILKPISPDGKDEPGYATAGMLYIHPDECIDCGACVPACPVEAIFSLDETPHQWASYIAKNADYYPR